MDVTVHTHALIPRRLILDAAHHSQSQAFGRFGKSVKDVRVTVTDRPRKPGATSCQVEIDLSGGLSVVARSTSTDPVEVVSQAFDKAARSVAGRLRQRRARQRAEQVVQPGAAETAVPLA